MIKLQFSRMTVEDVPAVMVTEEAVYPFPWTDGIFRDCIRVGYQCWLAYEDGRLIGHAVMSVAAGECHLLNLSVATGDQGKGYGRQFVVFLMEIAKQQGADSMLLEVRPSNLAAIHLYQSCHHILLHWGSRTFHDLVANRFQLDLGTDFLTNQTF